MGKQTLRTRRAGLPGLPQPGPGLASGAVVAGAPPQSARPGTLRRKGRATSAEHLKILQRGIDLQRVGKLQAAEYQYQLILREDPNNADALNLIGVLASEAKQYDVAIDYLERALALRPRDVIILNNLANAYILIEAYKKAVPLLERAIRIDPNVFQTQGNLGRAYRQLGRADEAIELFSKVLESEPGNQTAGVGLGQALVDAGRMDDAIAAFRRIACQVEKPVAALSGIAAATKFTGSEPELEQIEALLSDADLMPSERETLHHAAGKIYNDLKQYDDAFRHFRSAKEIAGSSFKLESFSAELDELISVLLFGLLRRSRA